MFRKSATGCRVAKVSPWRCGQSSAPHCLSWDWITRPITCCHSGWSVPASVPPDWVFIIAQTSGRSVGPTPEPDSPISRYCLPYERVRCALDWHCLDKKFTEDLIWTLIRSSSSASGSPVRSRHGSQIHRLARPPSSFTSLNEHRLAVWLHRECLILYSSLASLLPFNILPGRAEVFFFDLDIIRPVLELFWSCSRHSQFDPILFEINWTKRTS